MEDYNDAHKLVTKVGSQSPDKRKRESLEQMDKDTAIYLANLINNIQFGSEKIELQKQKGMELMDLVK